MQNEILQQWINQCNQIVFFGGAGVSTESGIPDFRSKEGLYHQKYAYPPEQILSHTFFMGHTVEFYDFYRKKMLFPNAKPNAAHRKLAELEQKGKLIAVITQNIDGLHQAAGSKNVLELHGSIYRNYCMRCHKFFPIEKILRTTGIPRCECGGNIKPDVVLYEEDLKKEVMQKTRLALSHADMLIIGGTSLKVYPAAGFLDYYSGQRMVFINQSCTAYDAKANLRLTGNIGEILDFIVINGRKEVLP